jgi:hypothetical protein
MLIGRQKVENCAKCPFCKPSVQATQLFNFCSQGGFEPQRYVPTGIPPACPFDYEPVQRSFQMLKMIDLTLAAELEGRN